MAQPLSIEAQLMRRIRDRDESAFSELYTRYGGMVYGMCYRVLQDQTLAEEATQDSFLKVWNQAHTWDNAKGSLATWLLTISRFTAIDRLRKEKRETPNSSVDIDDMLEFLAQYADDRNNIEALKGYLAQLPKEQREAIELAFYSGFSHSDIATRLNIPIGTIKSRVRLGLLRLKSLWLGE
jgi:RNA polymerase sigma-70 factor, ECF subfamily